MENTRRRLSLLLFVALSACSGPSLLSGVDRITGGGSGVTRIAQAVPYGSHGQMLDIYRPDRPADGGYPVVVFVHGGSWESGNRGGYAFAGRGLARLGVVAVVIDYRKLPEHRFPDFQYDAAEAVEWSVRNIADHGGDPGRIFLAGHSAGAQIAVLTALDRQYLQSMGLNDAALAGVIGISGPYDFHPFTVESVRAAFAGAEPATTQPITYARGDAPPMLLLHGEADETVLPANSVKLADAIRGAGGEASLRLYPGLGHVGAITALTALSGGKADIGGAIAAFVGTAGAD